MPQTNALAYFTATEKDSFKRRSPRRRVERPSGVVEIGDGAQPFPRRLQEVQDVVTIGLEQAPFVVFVYFFHHLNK
jgi:hypothetical protein